MTDECVMDFRCALDGVVYPVRFVRDGRGKLSIPAQQELVQHTENPQEKILRRMYANEPEKLAFALERLSGKPEHSEEIKQTVSRSINFSDLDVSNWCCHGCGNENFVRCGKCREFVCGGKVKRDEKGQLFQCHTGCGREGYISGTIEEKDSVSVKKEVSAPTITVQSVATPRISAEKRGLLQDDKRNDTSKKDPIYLIPQ